MNYFLRRCRYVMLLGVLAMASHGWAEELRIGFVNTDRVLKEANTAKAAQAKMDSVANAAKDTINATLENAQDATKEAADKIIDSMEAAIQSKKVTYDFARLMDGATQVSCSGFGQVMIEHM